MSDLDVLAGIIASDGHISNKGYSVRVINTNTEFLKTVAIPLMKKYSGKNPSKYFISSGFGNGKFVINVSSKEFWKTFIEKYNIPAGSKSLAIQPPDLPRLENRIDYLLGWIAGDGSVTHDRMRVKIEIWSKSEPMILWFRDVLKEMGIGTTIFKEKNKNEFILRVGRKEELLKFYKEMKVPHPEKQRRFDRLIKKWIS